MQLDVLPVACDLSMNNEKEKTQDVLKQHVMILRKCDYLGLSTSKLLYFPC